MKTLGKVVGEIESDQKVKKRNNNNNPIFQKVYAVVQSNFYRNVPKHEISFLTNKILLLK